MTRETPFASSLLTAHFGDRLHALQGRKESGSEESIEWNAASLSETSNQTSSRSPTRSSHVRRSSDMSRPCHMHPAALLPSSCGNYQLLRPIMQGAMGLLYLADDTTSEREVTIKSVPLHPRPPRHVAAGLLAHQRLQYHPFVLEFVEAFITPERKQLVVVTDMANAGDLQRYVRGVDPQHHRLPEPVVRWFFQQLVVALNYCHDRGVTHRNLHPAAVLLHNDDDGARLPLPTIKICAVSPGEEDYACLAWIDAYERLYRRSKMGQMSAANGHVGGVGAAAAGGMTGVFNGGGGSAFNGGVGVGESVGGKSGAERCKFHPYDIKLQQAYRQSQTESKAQISKPNPHVKGQSVHGNEGRCYKEEEEPLPWPSVVAVLPSTTICTPSMLCAAPELILAELSGTTESEVWNGSKCKVADSSCRADVCGPQVCVSGTGNGDMQLGKVVKVEMSDDDNEMMCKADGSCADGMSHNAGWRSNLMRNTAPISISRFNNSPKDENALTSGTAACALSSDNWSMVMGANNLKTGDAAYNGATDVVRDHVNNSISNGVGNEIATKPNATDGSGNNSSTCGPSPTPLHPAVAGRFSLDGRAACMTPQITTNSIANKDTTSHHHVRFSADGATQMTGQRMTSFLAAGSRGGHNPDLVDGKAADAWSVGAVMFEMLSGASLWGRGMITLGELRHTMRQEAHLINESWLRSRLPPVTSPECISLLSGLLRSPASQRLTLKDATTHPLFLKNLPECYLSLNDAALSAPEETHQRKVLTYLLLQSHLAMGGEWGN